MASIAQWAEFFTGDYELYVKNAAGKWERQGSSGAAVRITFAANGELEDETAQLCLKATFTPRNLPSFVVAHGYFHLKKYRGANHISGDKHPGNWHGNSVITPDLYLDGGVIEGPAGGGGRYFRFGVWEATDTGDDTFYPSGEQVRIKFQGKEHKPVSSPINEVRLLSTWRKLRPDSNYPWNIQ